MTDHFDMLMEEVRLPSLLVDSAGRILAGNPAARVSFGALPEGTLFSLKFRAPEMREAFAAAIEGPLTAHCDYHVRVPDERWYRVEFAPVRRDRENVQCLVLFSDVSEARKIEQMRADFIANASHELRTPLASLSGFIETLRGPARTDLKAQEKFLAIMQDQANRMSRLIDDLLSLSRLEMRPFAQLVDVVDLAALASSVVATFQPKQKEKGLVIELGVGSGSFFVSGLRDELTQAMENLIENACKYGASGGRILVSLDHDQHTADVVFSVQDFGPGISPIDLPRLTERFYRSENAHDASIRGTGLGLAIVKHIVQRHQGELAIQSKPGAGSTFTIRLKRQ